MKRGFFAVGVYHPKTEANIGSLWRTAHLYGAAFVFTVGRRYRAQSSDTPKTPRHTPLFHFDNIGDLMAHLPHGAPLVGVEMDDAATPLPELAHPLQAVYLLGAEDHGLPPEVLAACHRLTVIPCPAPESMNVAVAGALVIYDRHMKSLGDAP